jgi:hypothetical protein
MLLSHQPAVRVKVKVHFRVRVDIRVRMALLAQGHGGTGGGDTPASLCNTLSVETRLQVQVLRDVVSSRPMAVVATVATAAPLQVLRVVSSRAMAIVAQQV